MGSSRHAVGRRRRLFQTYAIDLVLDVGANVGQYGHQLRTAGYHARIESFEPLKQAYDELRTVASKAERWNTHNYGLSDSCGDLNINVSSNSVSSSLLAILPAHVRAEPESHYVREELVTLKTLDSVFPDIVRGARSVFMKIDTHGFENKVLEGARESLASIDTIELEMSLVPLYDGQMLFSELHALMLERGYELVSMAPGFSSATTGELLQLDGTYHRSTGGRPS